MINKNVRVAVFVDRSEILVVGIDKNNNPIDPDGTLFGTESGRNIEEFERYDADFSREIIKIETICQVSVQG